MCLYYDDWGRINFLSANIVCFEPILMIANQLYYHAEFWILIIRTYLNKDQGLIARLRFVIISRCR